MVGFVSAFAMGLACKGHAMPVDQYLKLRRTSGMDRSLTYASIAANPSNYVGKILELRGTVNGSLRREQTVTFMLTMEGKGIFMDAPPADTRMVTEVSNQTIRVLVKVTEPKSGNIVPMQALALAYDGEVTLREQEAEHAEAVANRRVAQERPTMSNVHFGSRGGTQVPVAGPSNPANLSEISALGKQVLTAEALSIYPYYKTFIYKSNRKLTSKQLDDITVSVLHFSQKYRVDPRLVCAMLIAESDFDPKCTSNKGAMGLGQVMPDEAKDLHLTNPYDPIQNVGAAVNLLKGKLNMYSEGSPDGQLTLRQVQLALAAYNAGPGAVKKYGGIPPYRETQGYVKRILKLYNELCGN